MKNISVKTDFHPDQVWRHLWASDTLRCGRVFVNISSWGKPDRLQTLNIHRTILRDDGLYWEHWSGRSTTLSVCRVPERTVDVSQSAAVGMIQSVVVSLSVIKSVWKSPFPPVETRRTAILVFVRCQPPDDVLVRETNMKNTAVCEHNTSKLSAVTPASRLTKHSKTQNNNNLEYEQSKYFKQTNKSQWSEPGPFRLQEKTSFIHWTVSIWSQCNLIMINNQL